MALAKIDHNSSIQKRLITLRKSKLKTIEQLLILQRLSNSPPEQLYKQRSQNNRKINKNNQNMKLKSVILEIKAIIREDIKKVDISKSSITTIKKKVNLTSIIVLK